MSRKPIALEQYTDQLGNLAGFIVRACAFTGHRPQKLQWRDDETAPRYSRADVRERATNGSERAVPSGTFD